MTSYEKTTQSHSNEGGVTIKNAQPAQCELGSGVSVSEARLLRRIDLRLMPAVLVLYLWTFLDRINISNAITLGLQSQLHLKGNDVNVALALFYVPYIVLEIPSNYALKRVGTRNWLSGSMILFGVIVLCHGFVTNYSGLLAARVFLGVAESGILPGCTYLLTMWYKPSEILQRYTLFLNSISLAGAFGSLLASGIAKMDGLRGVAGWQWIFILEGIATVLIGIAMFFLAPGLPENAKWLTAEEKDLVKARLHDQMVKEESTTVLAELRIYFSNWKSYVAGLFYFGCITVGYSITYFLPTIVKGFHYSDSIQVQLHAIPPYAAAFGWSTVLSLAVYRFPRAIRLTAAIFSLCLVFVGVGILFNIHTNLDAQYAAVFLMAMGLFGGLPIVLVACYMELERNWQRAIGTAYIISFGNIGGIVATFSFAADDAPFYLRGYSIITFATCLSVACTAVLIVDAVLSRKRE